jgi:alkanesulfonate monooxygenase SsuD/methylene tetrahydromethanopterin reductase-like flavin-dependent oxidoreductase (luciferase family)
MRSVLCWRNADERERRIQAMRSTVPLIGAMSVQEVLEWHEAHAILGTPEQVIEQIQAYGSAGADEIMLRWMGMDDVEGLYVLAENVLARLDAEK